MSPKTVKEKKRGSVHLYTGEGEGKTVTAFGRALRAVGHGYKVVVIQFMKGRRDVGEYKVAKRLAPELEIYQFGREEFVNLANPEAVDVELANEALNFAREVLKKKPKLLVLDEINLATAIGLLKLEDVLKLLDEVPSSTVVILTGRRASRELIDRADLVTIMKEVKHPMEKGVPARKGIEY